MTLKLDGIKEAVLNLMADAEYNQLRLGHTQSRLAIEHFDRFLIQKYKDAPEAQSLSERFPGHDLENLTPSQQQYRENLEVIKGSAKMVSLAPEHKMMMGMLREQAGRKAEAQNNYAGKKFSEAGLGAEDAPVAKGLLSAFENLQHAPVNTSQPLNAPLAYSAQVVAEKETMKI